MIQKRIKMNRCGTADGEKKTIVGKVNRIQIQVRTGIFRNWRVACGGPGRKKGPKVRRKKVKREDGRGKGG